MKDKWNRPTIPCGLCGTPTAMLGTRRCDSCWELEHRVRANPELTQRILAGWLKDYHGPVLLLDGIAYEVSSGKLLVNGLAKDPTQVGNREMAKLALVRAALDTAETSLL